MIARTSTLLALLALGALVSGCATETLEKGEIEGFVEKTAKDLGVKVESVECPDDVESKKGESFKCTVKARSGKEAEITIQQTSDNGNVLVRPREFAELLGKDGATVEVDKVEREISKKVSSKSNGEITASSVVCPEVRVKAGKKFTCKVTSENGKTTKFAVTWTDDRGGYRFEGNLDALAP